MIPFFCGIFFSLSIFYLLGFIVMYAKVNVLSFLTVSSVPQQLSCPEKHSRNYNEILSTTAAAVTALRHKNTVSFDEMSFILFTYILFLWTIISWKLLISWGFCSNLFVAKLFLSVRLSTPCFSEVITEIQTPYLSALDFCNSPVEIFSLMNWIFS